jgi:hypothetical protein
MHPGHPLLAIVGGESWTMTLPYVGSIPVLHAWIGVVLLALLLSLVFGRRFGSWARLVELYPAAPMQSCRGLLWVDLLIFGRGRIRNSTWFEIDEGNLHVSAVKPLHLVRAPFSVPLAEITATPDVWMGGVLRQPVVRLTLARDPSLRIMVTPRLFERLAAMSDGRLRFGHPLQARG